MTIETRFDLDQKVYFRKGLVYYLFGNENDKVISGVICGILIRNGLIKYEIDSNGSYLGELYEEDIFSTKEEVFLQGKVYPTCYNPRVPPLDPNTKPNFKNLFKKENK